MTSLTLRDVAARAALPLFGVKDIIQYIYEHTYVYLVCETEETMCIDNFSHWNRTLATDVETLLQTVAFDPCVVTHVFRKWDGTQYAVYTDNMDANGYKRPDPYSARFRALADTFKSTPTLVIGADESIDDYHDRFSRLVLQEFTEEEWRDIFLVMDGYVTIIRISDMTPVRVYPACTHEWNDPACSLSCGLMTYKYVFTRMFFDDDGDDYPDIIGFCEWEEDL